MNGMRYILQKELTRVFTDKKLVLSLFIMPVVLIIGMYVLMGNMQSSAANDIEEHIPTIYIQNEPKGLKNIIEQTKFKANFKYLSPDDEVSGIKKDILNGNIELLVVFEEDFLNKINSYEAGGAIPEVKTFYNNSEDYSNIARSNFISTVVESYRQHLLLLRFGDLGQLKIFDVDRDPGTSVIVDDKKASGKIFGTLLPYLITFMLFAGAMSLGVDAITGEKERGTMASMLLTPLKRQEIVLGKLLSLAILSCLSAAVYAVTMIIAMPIMLKGFGGGGMEGLTLHFSVVQVLELLAIMLSLVYLYVSIVALASVLAKTAKEASTYIVPIYIVVLAAGMITMFTGNSEKALSMFAIPVYGSAISIQNILVGELTLAQFGVTVGGTLFIAVLMTVLITKAFNSEKVMFNA